MTSKNRSKPNENITTAGREEFFEDVFGLNFRSAKSIWTLFKAPKDYFQAAKSPNWENRYTPSIRLMLVIAAITISLEFIWAKPNGNFIESLHSALIDGLKHGLAANEMEVDTSSIDLREPITEAMKFSGVIYPPIYIVFLSLFAWAYRAWGEELPYVVRQRFIFALGVPVGILGVLWLIIMSFTDSKLTDILGYSQIIVLLILFFFTAVRGPFGHMQKSNAVGRGIVLSLSLFFCIMLAQLVAIGISFAYVARPEITEAIKTQLHV